MTQLEPMDTIQPVEMVDVSVGSMLDSSSIVVQHVTWTVRTGDYWVIAGLHGSGKTDFLSMTGGLMPPVAGTYHLFGEPMPIFEDARLSTRLRLGLVFDSGRLFNRLTVWENIALPLRYHRRLKPDELGAQVQKFIESMQLGPYADSFPGTLGRNWQKRAGLARALILSPEVLLVDNPLAGLDLRELNWWLSFLDNLNQGHVLLGGRPLTLIVTASDFRSWQGHARHFATLRKDRLTSLGSWAEMQSADKQEVGEFLN